MAIGYWGSFTVSLSFFVDAEAEFIYVPANEVIEQSKKSGAVHLIFPLFHNNAKDYELLSAGMKIYDALHSWAKYLQAAKLTWVPA